MEYHQHKTTEYYDLSMGSNSKESILMIITTAGVSLKVPCYTQEYPYCEKILNGIAENESYFVDIMELEKGDSIENQRNWFKANPIRMTYTEGQKKLKEAFEVGANIPEKMIAFKQKCCNMWLDAEKMKYLDYDLFKKHAVNAPPIDLKNREVFIGIDISRKIDLTSVTFMYPYKDEYGTLCQYFEAYSFVPNQECIMKHQEKDRMPFLYWAEKGYIIPTNTPIVDQGYILDFCYKRIKELGLQEVKWCIDPHNASLLTTQLLDKGERVFEIYYSFKHQNEPCVAFREQLREGRISYLKNDCMMWQFSNAEVRTDPNGLIKVDKSLQENRIDAVDSTICAFKLSMYWKPKVDLNAYYSDWSL